MRVDREMLPMSAAGVIRVKAQSSKRQASGSPPPTYTPRALRCQGWQALGDQIGAENQEYAGHDCGVVDGEPAL